MRDVVYIVLFWTFRALLDQEEGALIKGLFGKLRDKQGVERTQLMLGKAQLRKGDHLELIKHMRSGDGSSTRAINT